MMLSKNISLHEMVKSQVAERHGIANTPAMHHIERMKVLCEKVLQPIRSHFNVPLIITSGYRCPELNAALRSKPTSQHMAGIAADFELLGYDNMQIAEWVRDNLEFDQLILEYYTPGEPDSGWVHVSYVSPDMNRGECLTVSRNGTSMGIIA